jgi:carboxyl-terminal processing protease
LKHIFERFSKKYLHHHSVHLPNAAALLVVAFVLALGYGLGANRYRIEAFIGPVFGYNAHAGELDLSSLQDTYGKLAGNYDGKLDDKALIEGAKRGLVEAAGDIYTEYFDSADAKEFMDGLNGDYGAGIGAMVGMKNDFVTILKPLKDNPAIAAGIQANDIVVAINDQDITGWSVDKAVSQIKGEAGTTVKLKINRGGIMMDYSITRATINKPSVESTIDGSVGIMTIDRFDSKTKNQARQAAEEFKSKGVKSVILDLRDNSGGYVDAAVDVAGIWLSNKVVVVEKNGDVTKTTLRSGSNTILEGVPTVVLVNSQTASASEIVTGALQDYGVAKVVGETTLGKGSVQQTINLSDGAMMKVTVAKWYTPNGKNISKEGLAPDISVSLSQDDFNNGRDTQLEAAKKELGV